MAKFIVSDTQAVWVTWKYEIEAKTAKQARQKYIDEQPASHTSPEIGDTIEGYEQIIKVE